MSEKTAALPAALREALGSIPGCRVSFDEPLSRHTGLATGGPADALCRAGTREALASVLELLGRMTVPHLMLGHGTNLIPSDSGLRGVAVRLEGGFETAEASGRSLRAGAAVSLSALVECAMRNDLGGLEFTAGIPGCVGGSLPGNAGSGEEALGTRVDSVEFMSRSGSVRVVPGEKLGFAYRRSSIPSVGEPIVSATFRLEPRFRKEAAETVRRYTEKRRGQPLSDPNVGCMFKNPPGKHAGRLIEEAGLKGEREGGAEVSPRHANFIVNRGGATTADVLDLMRRIRGRVLDVSGVALETEVTVVDENGRAFDPLEERA